MNVKLLGAIVMIIAVVMLIVSPILSITAYNILAGTRIPINLNTWLAVVWFEMIITGLLTAGKSLK